LRLPPLFSANQRDIPLPSIRYAGRLAGHPPGRLTLAEAFLQTGVHSQDADPARWGDYSMLAVDPIDDSTFWYVNQYIGENPLAWNTRIGSFRFTNSIPAPSLPPGSYADTLVFASLAGSPYYIIPVSLLIANAPAALEFNSDYQTVDKTNSGAEVEVLRSGGTSGVAWVDYTTDEASARDGVDYRTAQRTLFFPTGVTRKTIPASPFLPIPIGRWHPTT